jgi:hypothetical protein
LLTQFEQLRKENIQILLSTESYFWWPEEDRDTSCIWPCDAKAIAGCMGCAWHDPYPPAFKVIAKQYLEEVGPWKEYMGVLKRETWVVSRETWAWDVRRETWVIFFLCGILCVLCVYVAVAEM